MLTQKEKRQVLDNDRSVRTNTFLSHTHNDEGGRFNKPWSVTGETPAPDVPKLPEGSWPNQSAVVPDELPLGFSIEDHEPVGETFEVAQSLGVQQSEPVGAMGSGVGVSEAVTEDDLLPPQLAASPQSDLGEEVAPATSVNPSPDAAVETPPRPPNPVQDIVRRMLVRKE